MSRLTDLIANLKAKDSRLAADLEREFRALSSRLSFGLNFERHTPESVELPGRPIRRGDKVRILPARGCTHKGDQRLWLVKKIATDRTYADLELLDPHAAEGSYVHEQAKTSVPLEDLVVVAEFRDVIYPGLISTGTVSRASDKSSWHTVINGENYHVLKALTWTHRGKIDAIYIDPPYNSGARDWKYNNDYVEGDDMYRHSKWLAMMERRLLVAKDLLNPTNSVLIVTIDEKEYLRLGLLLDQTFPEARITMVSSSINSAGATRKGTFARAAEYLYFVQHGASRPAPLELGAEWNPVKTNNKKDIYWSRLIRSGADSARTDSPNQFYPVVIRNTTTGPIFEAIGAPFYGDDRESVSVPSGCEAVWPIRKNKTEGRWRVSAGVLRELLESGCVRLGGWRGKDTTVYYLKQGEQKKVQQGVFQIVGRRADGSVITDSSGYATRFIPTDIWRITSHDAGNSGSRLIDKLIPGRKFQFPKALYAVEDALRFFIGDNRNAVVLDFFSGSGTTAHAVMRLNKHDGGNRQCISVTNNEVAADEQRALREQNLRPGDADWEKLGVCDYITKPRVAAAITGKTPDGRPIDGEYQFGQSVKGEKPRRFKHVSFVKPADLDTVAKKKQFLGLIDSFPQTLVTDSCRFVVSEDEKHTASVLFDPDAVDDWLEALDGQEHITEFVILAPNSQTFTTIKEQVVELLGPVIVTEVEKWPIADGFEANAEFFTLTYETPVAVSYQTAFARIASLLWLRAGSVGRRIHKVPAAGWEVVDTYGLLVDLDKATDFLKAVRRGGEVRIAYMVTDDERRFQSIARRLPDGVEPIRLYESYLTNFAFANGD